MADSKRLKGPGSEGTPGFGKMSMGMYNKPGMYKQPGMVLSKHMHGPGKYTIGTGGKKLK